MSERVLGVFAREPYSECVMDQMTPTHAIAGQCFTPLQIAPESGECISRCAADRTHFLCDLGRVYGVPAERRKIYIRSRSARKIAPQQSARQG